MALLIKIRDTLCSKDDFCDESLFSKSKSERDIYFI